MRSTDAPGFKPGGVPRSPTKDALVSKWQSAIEEQKSNEELRVQYHKERRYSQDNGNTLGQFLVNNHMIQNQSVSPWQNSHHCRRYDDDIPLPSLTSAEEMERAGGKIYHHPGYSEDDKALLRWKARVNGSKHTKDRFTAFQEAYTDQGYFQHRGEMAPPGGARPQSPSSRADSPKKRMEHKALMKAQSYHSSPTKARNRQPLFSRQSLAQTESPSRNSISPRKSLMERRNRISAENRDSAANDSRSNQRGYRGTPLSPSNAGQASKDETRYPSPTLRERYEAQRSPKKESKKSVDFVGDWYESSSGEVSSFRERRDGTGHRNQRETHHDDPQFERDRYAMNYDDSPIRRPEYMPRLNHHASPRYSDPMYPPYFEPHYPRYPSQYLSHYVQSFPARYDRLMNADRPPYQFSDAEMRTHGRRYSPYRDQSPISGTLHEHRQVFTSFSKGPSIDENRDESSLKMTSPGSKHLSQQISSRLSPDRRPVEAGANRSILAETTHLLHNSRVPPIKALADEALMSPGSTSLQNEKQDFFFGESSVVALAQTAPSMCSSGPPTTIGHQALPETLYISREYAGRGNQPWAVAIR